MILVDTSVWVDHLRAGRPALAEILAEGRVLTHAFVIGELACGNLTSRRRFLANLATLPLAVSATQEEVLRLVEDRKLWGLGIGWIDAHLLASALLTGCLFWTLDGRLNRAAEAAGTRIYRR